MILRAPVYRLVASLRPTLISSSQILQKIPLKKRYLHLSSILSETKSSDSKNQEIFDLSNRTLSPETVAKNTAFKKRLSDLKDADSFGRTFPLEVKKETLHQESDLYKERETECNQSDIFGTLESATNETPAAPHHSSLLPVVERETSTAEEEDDDSSSPLDHIRLSSVGRRNEPGWYTGRIKKYGRRGDVKAAMKVFYEDVLVKDRVMPDHAMVNSLMSILAQSGLSEACFQLFNKAGELGLERLMSDYTYLFKACARDIDVARKNNLIDEEGRPIIDKTVKRVLGLWEKLKSQDVQMHKITYNSLIQALSKAGEIQIALKAVDDMMLKGFRPDTYTLTSLLSACSYDRRLGSGLAVNLWRKFQSLNKFSFIAQHYTVLLAVLSKAEFGPDFAVSLAGGGGDTPLLGKPVDPKAKVVPFQLPANHLQHSSKKPKTVTSTSPWERVSIVGGITGIIDHMRQNQVEPTLEHFTQLIDCLPPTLEDEVAFRETMNQFPQIKPDLTFMHRLIRRRGILRKSVDDLLQEMTQIGLSPDIMTFGCLAHSCLDIATANQLFLDMKTAGFTLNINIFATLIYASRFNWKYKLFLLESFKASGLKPNKKLLISIEESMTLFRKRTLAGQVKKVELERGFQTFKRAYNLWINEVELQPPHNTSDFNFSKRKKKTKP